jgi:hypothetical protein
MFMSSVIPIEHLEVIGYSDPRTREMVPSVVPPVFRFTGEARALVPPYILNGGFVLRPVEIDMDEVLDLAAGRDIILFEQPFPAQADFQLWLDQSFVPRYEYRTQAEENLLALSRQFMHSATVAFRFNNLEESDTQASAAISANPKCVESLALKAAIRRRENNPQGERLMASLAEPYLDQASFRVLVDSYSAVVMPKPVVSEKRSSTYRIACFR